MYTYWIYFVILLGKYIFKKFLTILKTSSKSHKGNKMVILSNTLNKKMTFISLPKWFEENSSLPKFPEAP